MLFSTCLKYARTAPYDDLRKSHAVQLMTVIIRGLLSKSDFAGWEVMELFAGGVNQSDKFFNVLKFSSLLYTLLTKDPPQEFSVTIGTLLGDDDAPGKLHSSLCLWDPAGH
jgi:hypothetical protein